MLACFPITIEQYIPCGPFLNSKGRLLFGHTFWRNSDYAGKRVKGFQEHHIKTFADELRTLPLSERQVCLDRRRQTIEVISQVSVNRNCVGAAPHRCPVCKRRCCVATQCEKRAYHGTAQQTSGTGRNVCPIYRSANSADRLEQNPRESYRNRL